MSSINKNKEKGIKGEEALTLLLTIMQDRGVSEEAIDDVYFFIKDSLRKKRTANTRNTFEKIAGSIVEAYKYDLNNGYYHAFSSEMKTIFRNKNKGRIQTFIVDNLNYILIALSIMSMVLNVILKFV